MQDDTALSQARLYNISCDKSLVIVIQGLAMPWRRQASSRPTLGAWEYVSRQTGAPLLSTTCIAALLIYEWMSDMRYSTLGTSTGRWPQAYASLQNCRFMHVQ